VAFGDRGLQVRIGRKFRLTVLLIPLLCGFCLLGLGVWQATQEREFSGRIQYRNNSQTQIYVSAISGFGDDAECGVLIPGEMKTLQLSTRYVLQIELGVPYPQKTNLVWHVEGGAEQATELILKPGVQKKDAALCLDYLENGSWVAYFGPEM
jgi:hypothetical protein